MSPSEWTHGWRGLLAPYLLLIGPLYILLWRHRFRPAAYLRVLPVSSVLFLGATLIVALLQELLKAILGAAATHFPLNLAGPAVFTLTGVGYVKYLRARQVNETTLRGARIHSSEPTSAAVGRLTFAGQPIDIADEPRHFKLIGITGTGKSTAITHLLEGALQRGDRAIFADPDGGYLERFYTPARGDQILNPFDSRTAVWDLFGEITESYDIENLAHSLIPEGEATAREWRGYARVFLAEVIRHCYDRGLHDVAELWRLLTVAPSEELRPRLANTPAQPFLEPEAAHTFASLRSVCTSSIVGLRYLQSRQTTSLSIRRWVRESETGVLFIPYSASQIAALSSVIATWLRLGIFETLSQPLNAASHPSPIWFIVDELDALGPISGLKDALARLRKFGGRCVLGFQSIAQVSQTYGENEAQTLVENCGNTLILRCSSSRQGGTSEYASRLIGDREILRVEHTTSRTHHTGFGSTLPGTVSQSESPRHVTERAVMASEIEQLPDLCGYLKLASQMQWFKVDFR